MMIHTSELCEDIISELQELSENPPKDGLCGYDTGFKKLNEMTLGFTPGLGVLMGRPSMGKTAISLKIAHTVATQVPVLYFSIEMGSKQMIRRMISSKTKVNFNKLRNGLLEEADWDMLSLHIDSVRTSNIFFDDANPMTIDHIEQQCDIFKQTYPDFMVFIDYVQIITALGRFPSREREVASISNRLKALSKKIGVPFLILAQMNRDCESRNDPRPKASDLKESGSLEQDADWIMSIYRPERMIGQSSEYKGQTYFDLLKNREGEVGEVELEFIAEKQDFIER